MPLRTYVGGEYINKTIVKLDGEEQYIPGMRVLNADWKDVPFGMVVAVEFDDNCTLWPKSITVMWPFVPGNDLSKFAFPVMRRVFGSLLTNDLVSIQPMTAPVGGIFHLDYRYGSGSVKK